MKTKTAMQEAWYKINDAPDYSITMDGDIKNNKTNKIIVPVLSKGYYLVGLFMDGKRKFFLRHRLVALMFIPNTDQKPFINHKNGVKTDNRVCNLEWCTHSENVQHSYDMGMSESLRAAAKRMGIKNWSKAVSKRKKPVINTETSEIYESAALAYKQTVYSKSYFAQMLNGRKPNHTKYKYHENSN